MVNYNKCRGKEFKNKEIRNDRDNFERRIGRKKRMKGTKVQSKKQVLDRVKERHPDHWDGFFMNVFSQWENLEIVKISQMAEK